MQLNLWQSVRQLQQQQAELQISRLALQEDVASTGVSFLSVIVPIIVACLLVIIIIVVVILFIRRKKKS